MALSTQRSAVGKRFHDALMSIYLYNEYRGYTKLEELESALRRARPTESALADAIHAHARDERRHYRMFRAWFVRRGTMPFRVDTEAGYIDRLVYAATGERLATVDFDSTVVDDAALRRLCRLVMLTEQRGLAEVQWLLRYSTLVLDPDMRAMFEVVQHDEPSHFAPYEEWLAQYGGVTPTRRERLADLGTHLTIVWLKLPWLFFGPSTTRLEAFPA